MSEHEHHPDDLDESISNFDWAMRAIQRAEHQWRLDFIAESLGAAKDDSEDWTKNEADMQRLRDAWVSKQKELTNAPQRQTIATGLGIVTR